MTTAWSVARAEIPITTVSQAAPLRPKGLDGVGGDVFRTRDLREGKNVAIHEIQQDVERAYDEHAAKERRWDVLRRISDLTTEIAEVLESVVGPHDRHHRREYRTQRTGIVDDRRGYGGRRGAPGPESRSDDDDADRSDLQGAQDELHRSAESDAQVVESGHAQNDERGEWLHRPEGKCEVSDVQSDPGSIQLGENIAREPRKARSDRCQCGRRAEDGTHPAEHESPHGT
jgi:hypothetical protein